MLAKYEAELQKSRAEIARMKAEVERLREASSQAMAEVVRLSKIPGVAKNDMLKRQMAQLRSQVDQNKKDQERLLQLEELELKRLNNSVIQIDNQQQLLTKHKKDLWLRKLGAETPDPAIGSPPPK
jgi:hypothetical protein